MNAHSSMIHVRMDNDKYLFLSDLSGLLFRISRKMGILDHLRVEDCVRTWVH